MWDSDDSFINEGLVFIEFYEMQKCTKLNNKKIYLSCQPLRYFFICPQLLFENSSTRNKVKLAMVFESRDRSKGVCRFSPLWSNGPRGILMKPPRAYAVVSFISSTQPAEAPSFALRASAFADRSRLWPEGRRVPLGHSSMDLHPCSSAKADNFRNQAIRVSNPEPLKDPAHD